MKAGPFIRKLLPASLERKASRLYRSVFVDLGKVAAAISGALPKDALVLDIGGGDDDLLNHVLAARPDVRVAMVDIAVSVGKLLDPAYGARVELYPGTVIEDHVLGSAGRYDAAVTSDVQLGHLVARLGLSCDKCLSGDRGVALISAEQLCELPRASLAQHTARKIGLLEIDRPNYLVQLQFA